MIGMGKEKKREGEGEGEMVVDISECRLGTSDQRWERKQQQNGGRTEALACSQLQI